MSQDLTVSDSINKVPMLGNRFPDCVYIEISVKTSEKNNPTHQISKPTDKLGVFKGLRHLLFSSKPKEKTPQTSRESLRLCLTINFNEQWKKFPLPVGKIKFGIKNGELHVNLKGCEAPYNKRKYRAELETVVNKQVETQRASGVKNTFGLSLPFFKGTETSTGLNSESSKNKGIVEKFEITENQITTKGCTSSPKWVFEEKLGENKPLKGALDSTDFCMLDVMSLPIDIEALFLINDVTRDIVITDGISLYKTSSTKKRAAIIERFILRKFLEPELKPYLSQVSLKYE